MGIDAIDARGVTFESLPNKAAIEYFKNKIPAASAHWDDWIAPVHAKSFTVAGAPSVEFASDMHAAINKAISQGTTLGEFRKDFDKIVQQYGWSYKGKRGWRTSVIYNTNMRTARMAAKWQTIQDNKDVAPFLEYRAVNDSRTRPQHKAWDDIIRHADDGFWDTHYPPNGWGCRCTVVAMSGATMARKGKSVSDAPDIKTSDVVNRNGVVTHNVPAGVDVGWDSNVGQSWLAPDIALGKRLAALPPTMAGKSFLSRGLYSSSAFIAASIIFAWSAESMMMGTNLMRSFCPLAVASASRTVTHRLPSCVVNVDLASPRGAATASCEPPSASMTS
jgi:SPP1 gp7 family putative phage head morphogenesis protein